MLYMVTFTIHIPPMLAYIPYMDPMGYNHISLSTINIELIDDDNNDMTIRVSQLDPLIHSSQL